LGRDARRFDFLAGTLAFPLLNVAAFIDNRV
jgi:hypothetical protein